MSKAAKLEVVKWEEIEPVFDWETMSARIPECKTWTDSELAEDWYQRQAKMDAQRRPVTPYVPPRKKTKREEQIEMFKSNYSNVVETDARFEKFETKPDPKTGHIVGKVTLTIDTANAFDELAPLLKLQQTFVKVFIGGTQVSIKDLDAA